MQGNVRRLFAVAMVVGGASAALFGTGGASALADPGATAEIRGTVVDSSDSAPLEGVEVCAIPPTAPGESEAPDCVISGSGGGFALGDLAPGSYRLAFTPGPLVNNLAATFGPFPLAAGAAIEVVARLHRGAEFEGRVTPTRGPGWGSTGRPPASRSARSTPAPKRGSSASRWAAKAITCSPACPAAPT